MPLWVGVLGCSEETPSRAVDLAHRRFSDPRADGRADPRRQAEHIAFVILSPRAGVRLGDLPAPGRPDRKDVFMPPGDRDAHRGAALFASACSAATAIPSMRSHRRGSARAEHADANSAAPPVSISIAGSMNDVLGDRAARRREITSRTPSTRGTGSRTRCARLAGEGRPPISTRIRRTDGERDHSRRLGALLEHPSTPTHSGIVAHTTACRRRHDCWASETIRCADAQQQADRRDPHQSRVLGHGVPRRRDQQHHPPAQKAHARHEQRWQLVDRDLDREVGRVQIT